ncbi:hypothetical protein D3H55_04315 [Bacillus salacetis]|uniref:Uncharacterized protein n=1 Tax=Bacillus salacetis TaxID=2315464 RepID=A0A3A1R7G6_9BACI|nr:hypothetical protein [Bacillus salacetis]RIW37273.1 hypothetical protein D3H55_04315 [Bacillus salacetis]
MNGEKVSQLFKEIDQKEYTSIEFETVWRKSNRRGWINRYSHSLKHNLAILCTLLILAPVIGSLIVNSPGSEMDSDEADFHNKQDVIHGQTKRIEGKAVINGKASLPEGSIIQIKLMKRDNEKVIEEKEVTVGKVGTFSESFLVPEGKADYVVMLELYPHLQPKSIQEVIGGKGENLYSSSQVNGVYHYFMDQELYTGIRLYGEADREYLNQDKTMFGSLKSALP